MSEQWKSYAKHYCKICKIWLSGHARNVITHEQSERHKANEARYVVQLKREKREKEQMNNAIASEVRRINNIVNGGKPSTNGGGGSGYMVPPPPTEGIESVPKNIVPDGLTEPAPMTDEEKYKPVYKYNLPASRVGAGTAIMNKALAEAGLYNAGGASNNIVPSNIVPGTAHMVPGGSIVPANAEPANAEPIVSLITGDIPAPPPDREVGVIGEWKDVEEADMFENKFKEREFTEITSESNRSNTATRLEDDGVNIELEVPRKLKYKAPRAVKLDPQVKLKWLEEHNPAEAMRFKLQVEELGDRMDILRDQQLLGNTEATFLGDYGHLNKNDLKPKTKDLNLEWGMESDSVKPEVKTEGGGGMFRKRKKIKVEPSLKTEIKPE